LIFGDQPIISYGVAGSSLGHTFSEESKARVSAAKKGQPRNAETKAAMKARQTGSGNTFYGKTHSDETKLRLRAVAQARTKLPRADPVVMQNIETKEINRVKFIANLRCNFVT
jgi:NUMOD3 motif